MNCQNQANNLCQTEVPGFYILENFINSDYEKVLAKGIELEQEPWKKNRENRDVKIFGPWFDRRHRIYKDAKVTKLPSTYFEITKMVYITARTFFPEDHTLCQITNDEKTSYFVNKYEDNEGLRFHTDHPETYGNIIIGLSLLGDATLRFREKKSGREVGVNIPRGSLYFMTGSSRKDWEHGMYSGDCKEKRISITYRIVSQENLL